MSKFWEELSELHRRTLHDVGYEWVRSSSIANRYFTEVKKDTSGAIHQLYETLTRKGIPVDVEDPLYGNPFSIQRDGKNVTQDLCHSLEEVRSISQGIDLHTIQSVVEIGAGYGRTAYALLKKYPHLKYTIVDIEPALGIAQHYLNATLDNPPITFLHPTEIDGLTADLFISISLFDELTPQEIDAYFGAVDRGGKYFYYKCQKHWQNEVDHMLIGDDYPNRARWNKVYHRECLLSPNFFETLYEIRGTRQS